MRGIYEVTSIQQQFPMVKYLKKNLPAIIYILIDDRKHLTILYFIETEEIYEIKFLR